MAIENKVVIVGGCGHAGLPLGLVLADHGANVILLDHDPSKVDRVNKGQMPFREEGADKLLQNLIGSKLYATLDDSVIKTGDAIITVIGTPIDRHLNPTASDLYKSVDNLLPHIKERSLLVLRSIVYPGSTKLIYERIKTLNRDIHLAFCPERIAEGKALDELVNLPQIVSAYESKAMELATGLFSKITSTVIELSPLEAELAKLFTNSWRYINFAISNQFFILSQTLDLDFYKIYDAVTRDYPRMESFARPGFTAGPCLWKDTLQLVAFSENKFYMGQAAMLINEGLPNFIISQLRPIGLSNHIIAILGMAFKADSDDKRESLSYKLRNMLKAEAKEVLCTDPYVHDDSLVPIDEALNSADIIILGAPHAVYK